MILHVTVRRTRRRVFRQGPSDTTPSVPQMAARWYRDTASGAVRDAGVFRRAQTPPPISGSHSPPTRALQRELPTPMRRDLSSTGFWTPHREATSSTQRLQPFQDRFARPKTSHAETLMMSTKHLLASPQPPVSFDRTGRFASHKASFTPENLDVHHQVHVGGAASLVAAGVRTAVGTPSSPPWTVQTGKPAAGSWR